MSQTTADLPGFLQHADRGVRDAVLAALLAERMASTPGKPLDVPGVGVVMPLGPFGGTPPDLTPAEEAELADRMNRLDDTFTLEEFFADLETPPAVPPAGTRP